MIPPRHARSTFASYIPQNESGVNAMAACRQFVDGWPEVEGLLLTGPAGIGKTHLAVAALREIVSAGADGFFVDWSLLLQEIKASFGDPEASQAELMAPVLRSDLLVLDDLAAGKMTEWSTEILQCVIGERYNECRPTIITTNFGTDLVHRIGTRVRSRLAQMCTDVPMVGRDQRLASLDQTEQE